MTLNRVEQPVHLFLTEGKVQEIKKTFASVLSRPSFMDQADIPDPEILRDKTQQYVRAHTKLFERLPTIPIKGQEYSLANLQTNFLFGSSEASELRLLFFGFKSAVLGGDRYEYKLLSEDQVPKNLRGSFAIVRATDEYPNIELIEYLEPDEGLVDGVAFNPELERRVFETYSDIFKKLGYDMFKPITELVKEIFQGGDNLAISLALGYSLGSAIFFNLHDHLNPEASKSNQNFWGDLEKVLTMDQMVVIRDIAKQMSEGLSHQDFAKKLGIPTKIEDHYFRFKVAWQQSGLFSLLDNARKKFYDKNIYNGIKDLF